MDEQVESLGKERALLDNALLFLVAKMHLRVSADRSFAGPDFEDMGLIERPPRA